MKNKFIDQYQSELNILKESGELFSKKHPEIAKNLQINRQEIDDPSVSRLIESMAFLNARTQLKIDEKTSDLAQALTSNLNPDFIKDTPSAAIIEFIPAIDLDDEVTIKRHTLLETDPARYDAYKFKTVYNTKILPIKICSAEMLRSDKDNELLQIALSTLSMAQSFSNFDTNQIRFYINNIKNDGSKIYEALFTKLTKITVVDHQGKLTGTLLPSALKQIGFNEDEALLPQPKESLPCYRLVKEYFSSNNKFMFFSIDGLSDCLKKLKQDMKIQFHFSQEITNLSKKVDNKSFALHCVPVVNLFDKYAEPIKLTHHEQELKLTVDNRKPNLYEVYEVKEVHAISNTGEQIAVKKYGTIHHNEHDEVYWQSKERTSIMANRKDCYLTIIDPHGKLLRDGSWTLQTKVTCCNYKLPRDLAETGQMTQLTFTDISAPIRKVTWLELPSMPATLSEYKTRPEYLIAHLNLNYKSLVFDNGLALKGLLNIYNIRNDNFLTKLITNIIEIKSKKITRRSPEFRNNVYCHGIGIAIYIAPGKATYLFFCIVNQLLSMSISMNSFIELTVLNINDNQEIYKWPVKFGNKKIL